MTPEDLLIAKPISNRARRLALGVFGTINTANVYLSTNSAFHLETQDRIRNLYGDENSVHNTRSAAWFVIGFISKIFEYEKIH